jgi:dTDP-glucose 4,6-dehydratase
MKKNKIIVTGGSGFIGTNLILSLIKKKNNIVLNIDNLTYASNKNKILNKFSNYHFIKENIIYKNKIRELIFKFKPTIIFHLAAETHVDRSINKSNIFINTNVIGTYSLVEAFHEYISFNQKAFRLNYKFIYISTDEVYGDIVDKKHQRSKENDLILPSSPYSSTKAASEMILNSWKRTFNFPSIICRPSNNYGPFQHKEKLIPLVISSFLKKKTIPIYGDGSQIRNWIFVEDTVNALIKVMNNSKLGKVYNISSDIEMKNIKIIKLIHKELLISKLITEKNINNFLKFVPDRLGHDIRYSIHNSKIKNELNWKSKTSLENGIKETIKWYSRKML